MPRWIYNRPPEKCQENEFRLAQRLNDCLPESWIVRWGYWYEDNAGTLREGDFLVLGPQGGLAVLEVKSSLSYQSASGQWDTSDGDNPLIQLQDQHQGVIRHLESVANGRRLPFITKALVLPGLEIAPNIPEFRGVPRQLILAGNDLRHFERSWGKLFPGLRTLESAQSAVFIDGYGDGLNPRSVKAFISETDQMLLRQATASYRLLNLLAGNRQLVVEGGVGTGKSWYAIEHTRRLAENIEGEAGRDVLMVAYNLALCQRLRRNVAGLRLKRGSITVESAESLASSILEACGLEHEVPIELPAIREYYDQTLPQLALEALSCAPDKLTHLLGHFDALVVDEAQDHDTNLNDPGTNSIPETSEQLGWWSLYTALLSDGWQSPMAIFGDVAQRPPFRPTGRFQIEFLRSRLPQHAHVRLDQTLRYTRPIHEFLLQLNAEGTQDLVAGLPRQGALIDGPEVTTHETSSDAAIETIAEILADWQASGLCTPSKVLLLYDRSQINRTPLAGVEFLHQHRLVSYGDLQDQPESNTIAHCSIHKAKGLDSLAIILIVPRAFDQLTEPYDRFTYFMGASRARQLLACVHISDAPSHR
jgi:hypothetical protein